MTESIVSNIGSIASIIGLAFVLRDNNSSSTVTRLIFIIVVLSCTTSYLIYKNSKFESSQYQAIAKSFTNSMNQRKISQEASALLSTFPVVVNHYETGDNEGIIYSVLGFLESHKDGHPELYSQFKTNVLADIEEAKATRGTVKHKEIMEHGAKTSIRLLTGLAGGYKNQQR